MIIVTWELIRNANSWDLLPQSYSIRNGGKGPCRILCFFFFFISDSDAYRSLRTTGALVRIMGFGIRWVWLSLSALFLLLEIIKLP